MSGAGFRLSCSDLTVFPSTYSSIRRVRRARSSSRCICVEPDTTAQRIAASRTSSRYRRAPWKGWAPRRVSTSMRARFLRLASPLTVSLPGRVVPTPVRQGDPAAGEVLVDARDGASPVDEPRVVDVHAERRKGHSGALDPPSIELVEGHLPRLGVDGRARNEDAVHVEHARDRVCREAQHALCLPRRGDEANQEPLHLPLLRKGLEQPRRRHPLVGQPTGPRTELGRGSSCRAA